MSDPVVLPKFELPGDKPHWAVRAAWISAVVLLFSIVGLGAVIMHRRNLEVQTHLAKQEAIARVKAEAEAKIAAAAAAARAAKEAELADRHATEAAAAAAKAAALAAKEPTADDTKTATKSSSKSSHRSHSGHGGKSSKVAAKVGGGGKSDVPAIVDKSTSGKKSSKPDPIDELMKKMK